MELGLRHAAWDAAHVTEVGARPWAAVFQRPAPAQAPDVGAPLFSGFIGAAGRRTPAPFFERIDALSESFDERGEGILATQYDHAEATVPKAPSVKASADAAFRLLPPEVRASESGSG